MFALALFDAIHHAVPKAMLTLFALASAATAFLWWGTRFQPAPNEWLAWVTLAGCLLFAFQRFIRSADRLGLAGLSVAYGPAAGIAILISLLMIRNRRIPLFAAMAPGTVLSAWVMRWLW
jgi:hypothetical protein